MGDVADDLIAEQFENDEHRDFALDVFGDEEDEVAASCRESTVDPLTAPFPYFGGKSLAAPIIWRAFGNVPNYVEPFFGSGATLLARPHRPKVETVNDKDGMIANFWRAVQHAPDEVAAHCDWPVNEADLHARHRWLVAQIPLLERLVDDPEWFDAKIAGWWVWGICQWIGGGWCYADRRLWQGRPELANANGRGVTAIGAAAETGKSRPDLSAANGRGVLARQMPSVGKPGNGIHSPTTGKKPLTHRNKGVHRDGLDGLIATFEALCARLRRVRVCCGDWTRILGRSTLGIDTAHGMTPCGIMLDPPYAHEIRDKRLYRADENVSDAVRKWAIENGDNPQLRIALCGFEGEHDMPPQWEKVAWKSKGSTKNHDRERIWFSPHCLRATVQGSLFDE